MPDLTLMIVLMMFGFGCCLVGILMAVWAIAEARDDLRRISFQLERISRALEQRTPQGGGSYGAVVPPPAGAAAPAPQLPTTAAVRTRAVPELAPEQIAKHLRNPPIAQGGFGTKINP